MPQHFKEVECHWIGCESNLSTCPGKGWYHCYCSGTTNEDHTSVIERYICPDCQSKLQPAPETPALTPAPTLAPDYLMQQDEEESDEFMVERVVDHGEDPGKPGTLTSLC